MVGLVETNTSFVSSESIKNGDVDKVDATAKVHGSYKVILTMSSY